MGAGQDNRGRASAAPAREGEIMRRAILALGLLVAASQATVSAGLAQSDGAAAPPMLATQAATPPAQFFGGLCAPGEVRLPDPLYFRNGEVALTGCYPLAHLEDLRQMDVTGHDRWTCRTAFPRADIRDELLANALACWLPGGVVIAWEGDRHDLPALMTDVTEFLVNGVMVVRYTGPAPR
jgi:hypothetical protein